MNTASITNFLTTKIPSPDLNSTLATLTARYPLFETGHLLQALLSDDPKRLWNKSIIYAPNPLLVEQRIRSFGTTSQHTETSKAERVQIDEAFTPPSDLPLTEPVTDELVFDALHTIDYFASQGIRLQQDQLGNDPLSNQVKTFTQWLKTLKKIYTHPNITAPNSEDSSVTRIANISNDQAEIITETMATILLQQGKKEQAIAVYQKLSLLHPEKSIYFTSRIQELNN